MAIRTPISIPGIYFTTFICFGWLPLLELINSYDLVYNWFKILKHNQHLIAGFVIMPNHIHLLIYYEKYYQSLNTVIGNGKRFMAYEIVRRLKNLDNKFYLQQLKIAVEPADKTRGKLHEVWQDSFDVKPCIGEQFLLHKLNYIHSNPCSKGWNLCSRPEEYLHSSAAFYINNRKSEILTHYKNII